MLNTFTQIKIDSLTTIQNSQTTENIESVFIESNPLWFWIALIEFIIILFFLFKKNKKKSSLDFADLSREKVKSAKMASIDMGNLMDSINNSRDLYKELSRSCHPDKYINSDKQKVAEDIFQNITKFKRDFRKLSELKKRAITELKIK
ncbi:MAG: hypothetical protein ACI9WV_000848 [Patiriisocius sp.]|jgi:hypothetical protein